MRERTLPFFKKVTKRYYLLRTKSVKFMQILLFEIKHLFFRLCYDIIRHTKKVLAFCEQYSGFPTHITFKIEQRLSLRACAI